MKSAIAAEKAPDSQRAKARTIRVALGIAALGIATTATISLRAAWKREQLRQTYLPQLESWAKQDGEDGQVLAVLGSRLIECGNYNRASQVLFQAVGAGETDAVVWQSLAAATAAGGDRSRALGYLRLARTHAARPQLLTGLETAATTAQSPQQQAFVISPNGAKPILARYASGSFLNSLTDWWSDRHPESSGYGTRQLRARQFPGDAPTQMRWAEALQRNRCEASAVNVLASLVQSSPDSFASRSAYADALLRAGRPEEASQQYLICLRTQDNSVPAAIGLGNALLAEVPPGDAVYAFTRATQEAPESADAWIGLGRANLLFPNNTRKAIAAFEEARRIAPERTDYLDDFAQSLVSNGEYRKAEDLLRKKLQSTPGDPSAHRQLAALLTRFQPTPERMDEAEREAQTAYTAAPHDVKVETTFGEILLQRQRFADAVTVLADASTHPPYQGHVFALLARAHQELGETSEAEAALHQSQAMSTCHDRINLLIFQQNDHPKDPKIHSDLSELYLQIGMLPQAQREHDIATLLTREHPKMSLRQTEASPRKLGVAEQEPPTRHPSAAP